MITDTRQAPFDVQPTIDGFAVIDARTGRPLDQRETAREAWGFATVLNQAATRGPKALAKALRAG